jgi:hypothetical protein|eukprot:COSAG06_NODE_4490_length_4208_cov_4.778535_2_plen_239_part_00
MRLSRHQSPLAHLDHCNMRWSEHTVEGPAEAQRVAVPPAHVVHRGAGPTAAACVGSREPPEVRLAGLVNRKNAPFLRPVANAAGRVLLLLSSSRRRCRVCGEKGFTTPHCAAAFQQNHLGAPTPPPEMAPTRSSLLLLGLAAAADAQSGQCGRTAADPCALDGSSSTYSEAIAGQRVITAAGCPNNNPVHVCVGDNPSPANTQGYTFSVPHTPQLNAATCTCPAAAQRLCQKSGQNAP